MTTKWLVAIISGLTVAILALAWITFAPPALGGRTTYVLTSGTSMQPGISDGDLVLLREQSSYDVGDIVAYEFNDRIILHRVIGLNGERLVVQGDNNPAPDPHQPTVDEIQGRLWLQIPAPARWDVPGSGFWVIIGLIFIGGVTVFMIPASSRATTAARDISTALEAHGLRLSGSRRFAPLLGTAGQILAGGIALLGLASLVLAMIAFSRPVEDSVLTETPLTQRAAFEYTADAPGSVYDGGTLETGDPIYSDLVDEVRFTFRYVMDSGFLADVSGTYRLDAVVRNADGWSSEIPLLDTTPFLGPRIEATAALNLNEVRERIATFEEAMGVEQAGYSLAIAPTLTVNGLEGDPPLRDTFAPSLVFLVDDTGLQLADPGGQRRGAAIQQIETATTVQREPVANTLPALASDIEVETARRLAIIGLALAVICGVVLVLMMRSAMRAPEPVQIAARYGARVVDLRGANLKVNGRLVEVAGFEDLLKVAGQGGRHVLHFQRDGRHFYFVHTADVTYGYRTSAAPQLASGASSELGARAGEPLRGGD